MQNEVDDLFGKLNKEAEKSLISEIELDELAVLRVKVVTQLKSNKKEVSSLLDIIKKQRDEL